MRRLEAFLRNKLEKIKISNRERRIESALNAAKINAEEKEMDAKLQLDKLGEKLADTDNVQDIISQMSEQMDIIEEAQLELKRVEEIKKYLDENVEVE